MHRLKQFAMYLLLGIGLTSVQSHASIIQSMTIEEIGVTSSGVGTSANLSIGGEARAYTVNGDLFTGMPFFFTSAGSTDGKILMGSVQANDAFTLGFTQGNGYPGKLNTSRGAPTGTIVGGILTLDLSGFTTDFGGLSFAFEPEETPVTATSMIDADHYYYTADWSHLVKDAEVFNLTTGAMYRGFTGWTLGAHLEGVATVPEPGTVGLLGISALGFMVARRRKRA